MTDQPEGLERIPTLNPLALLDKAISSGMDVEKLGRLMDLAERFEANEAAKAFGYAIQEFQRRMPAIVKSNEVRKKADDKGNPGPVMYTFAGYDDIMEIAQPIMAELGIVPTFTTNFANTMMTTTCRIRVGTHCEETSVSLGLPAIPNANDAQRAGAAMKYGQRYALCAALNIRVKGEDVDACGLDAGLDEKQVVELNTLFEECRAAGNPIDTDKFYKWLGCTDMNSMKAADLPKALVELNRKRRAKK